MKFRALRPDEVECRVGSVAKDRSYVTVLLYKDARCDMAILDETVAVEGWQRDHKEVKGNLYCGVGIYDNNLHEWIWKWDCGTESYTEKEKGEASDSFKRACFNWGIGRELYTAPFIKLENGNGCKIGDKGASLYAKVGKMETAEIDGRRIITKLVLVDGYGKELYNWESGNARPVGVTKSASARAEMKLTDKITEGGCDYITNLCIETKSDMAGLLKFYKINSLREMTVEQFNHCVAALERKKK